jgi:hypothetical protein
MHEARAPTDLARPATEPLHVLALASGARAASRREAAAELETRRLAIQAELRRLDEELADGTQRRVVADRAPPAAALRSARAVAAQ